ncbi:unnamed protein product, partial [Mesorhabditis belari]|uniref:EGF-like domain-containing protein n=1 Tax=Mesorhabditis belari TaxID=2138241 RepID=A0AAF3FM04_9BILA
MTIVKTFLTSSIVLFLIQSSTSTRISYLTRQFRSLLLFEADLDTGVILNETSLVTGFTDSDEIFLDADAKRNTLFYSLQGQIYAKTIDSKETKEITSFLAFLDERLTTLAYDSENELLYLGIANDGADTSARIEICSTRVDLVKKECAVLLYEHLDAPHFLVLNHDDGFMYWINSARNQIERSFMNGQHHDRHPFQDSISVFTSSMSPLTSLTLHQASNSLYYVRTSQSQSEIWHCTLSKRDSCSVIAKKEQILHFSIIQNFFIWSSFSGQMAFCKINSCEETSRFLKNFSKDFDPPELFIPLNKKPQITSVDNSCKVNNGGCSDYCLSMKFGNTCGCAKGVLLLDDQKTCDPRGSNQVLLTATTTGLFMIPIDTNASIPIYLHKSDNIAFKVEDMDWDSKRKEIVWIDRTNNKIHKSSLKRILQSYEIDDEAEPAIVRVDPITGNVIWLEKRLGVIRLTNLALNINRYIVVGLENSSGMAFDYISSTIFYISNHLDERRIFSILIDGMEHKILADVDFSMNTLEFDHETQKLYWIQGRKLQMMNSNGSKLESTKLEQSPGHVNSITKLNNTIYLSNPLGRRILTYQLENSKEIRISEINHGIYGLIKLRGVSLIANFSIKSSCSTNNGGCSHFCITKNLISTKCLCATFYELKADNRSCHLPSSSLLVGTQANLFTISSTGSLTELPIKKPIGNLVDVTIDQNHQMLIITSENGSYGEISSITFNGTKSRTILCHGSLKNVKSVGIDSRTRNIYWSNGNRLEMMDWSGRFRRTLFSNKEIQKLRIDENSNVYLLMKNPFSIWKISADGMERTKILNFTSPVMNFEIDERKIFWIEEMNGFQVKSSDLTGFQVQLESSKVISSLFLPFDSSIVFADPAKNIICRDQKTFHLNLLQGKINLLSKIHHQAQIPKKTTCDRLKCEHLCIDNDHGGKCLCADHYELDSMDVCKALESFVYISSSEGLHRISTKPSMLSNEESIISTNLETSGNHEHLAMVQFLSTYLLWTDSKTPGVIFIAKDFYDNQVQQIFLTSWNCSKILSMSIDSLGNQLFILCEKEVKQTLIYVFKIEENEKMIEISFIGMIFSSEFGYRRKEQRYAVDIAIFEQLGYLMYVDVGDPSRPKIYQCGFDGKNCRIWLNEGLRVDTKLFADPQHSRLFYTTPSGVWSRDIIAPRDSNTKHHYIRRGEHTRLTISSITEDRIFIAEDDRLTITDSKIEYAEIGTINSLLLVSPKTKSPQTCSRIDCPFICSHDQGMFKCLCPMKYTIGRYSGTQCEPESECSPWQFLCGDGRTCVHRAARCDFIRDCPDNSDEDPSFCEVVGVDRWPCEDGHGNIMRTSICDGKQDCKDNSDESHCRCSSNELDCLAWPGSQDNRCVHRQRLCDGFDDCESRLDENSLMCSNLSSMTFSQSTPEWLYLALLALLSLPLTVLFCWCCVRQKPLITTVVEQPIYHYNTGATTSILLPPESRGRHVELALRTYSVVDSSSSGQPLPAPNRYNGSNLSSVDRTGQSMLFYAPPPSAASLSTYGVVKPITMRFVDSNSQRRRWKSRDQNREPPPSYYESGSNLVQTSEPIIVDFPSPHQLRGEHLLTSRRIPFRSEDSTKSGSQRNLKENRRKRRLLVPSNSRLESEGEASSEESNDS